MVIETKTSEFVIRKEYNSLKRQLVWKMVHHLSVKDLEAALK
ncbi:hypothetical protein NBRC111894_2067 [Sporolactobacillus inulinus]|uniref:Uncharacterized protein n=1 Tax=Sporolactobacillus inulinus TaxID=2078 RepID=A0A4Y1ZC39_9BACL|nr:hypothetical protein NBRC111894_2067 [Sporolactobacillus inulinus]